MTAIVAVLIIANINIIEHYHLVVLKELVGLLVVVHLNCQSWSLRPKPVDQCEFLPTFDSIWS